MQVAEEKRVRRSQRDDSLAFKWAVVGEVARSKLSKKQAPRRDGIQGRSTVLVCCPRYATHFAALQQAGHASSGAGPAVEQTPEQRIKALETQLCDQKRLAAKELKDAQDLNLLLRTMLQVVEDHGIPLPKKSFRRPFPSWPLRRQRQAQQAARAEQVLVEVRAERAKLPRLGTRLGTRKLPHKIAPRLRAQDVACGRDALFTLLRGQQQLVPRKRSFTKTTASRHRFRKHPNLVKDASKPTPPNQLHVSDIAYLPTRQGTVC